MLKRTLLKEDKVTIISRRQKDLVRLEESIVKDVIKRRWKENWEKIRFRW
jgi:hypothetical protein